MLSDKIEDLKEKLNLIEMEENKNDSSMVSSETNKIEDLKGKLNLIEMEENKNDSSMLKSYEKIQESDKTEEIDEYKCYQENDFELLPNKTNFLSIQLASFHNKASQFISNNIKAIKWIFVGLLLIVHTIFFIVSVKCQLKKKQLWIIEDNVRLVWLSIILYLFVLCKLIIKLCKWKNITINIFRNISKKKVLGKALYIFYGILWLIIGIYIIYSAIVNDPYNLVSLSGIFVLLLISFCFSKTPHMVNWKPVSTGILLQFLFALLILTTPFGYYIFKFLGDRVTDFLNHTEAGCRMVFGDDFAKHYVAFRVLPIIIFLSSIISILYYLGVIQQMVVLLGSVMQKIMGTTCGESLNAAANIFLGMTESPLLIKPLVGRMTNSELHAVMTGGFATIAGSVLGAYIAYGAPANHLISASVMSAPAALAISKLMYPETKKSKNTKKDMKYLPKSPHKNIVEATTAGASDSIPLVANIAVNLIAFVSILAFFNSVLGWLGERACFTKKLSFELICSYLFWPLSLFMGVHIEDCRKIAELIGVKTFLNEFIAFQKLGVLLSNGKIFDYANKTLDKVIYRSDDILILFKNGTKVLLQGGILQHKRSVVIATYALCGFANCGSMGILLSSLSTMIPQRRSDLSKLVVRAMIAGNIACFLTACIAGLIYKE